MKLLLFLVLLAAGGLLVGKELMEVGQERRAGKYPGPAARRFRRRTKGVGLVLVLYAMSALYEPIARAIQISKHGSLMYFGLAVVLLIWVLILAGRDFRETVMDAASESARLRTEAMEKLDAELQRQAEERQRMLP